MWWLINNRGVNGLYNLGSGKARSWNDLAQAVFSALGKEPRINYIDLPANIAQQYQYFTEAKMDKFKATGCPVKFHSLEEGVRDYVVNHLQKTDPTW
jgi:ADP-L-glycero-D-manno-heptose 6-epimerase